MAKAKKSRPGSAKASSRPRGRPAKAKTALEHFLLIQRIRSHLKKNPSLRRACIRVQKEFYPARTVGGIRQTYLELTAIKPKPGAVPNSYGYIDGSDWVPARSGSKAGKRAIDFMRRFAFAITMAEKREKEGSLTASDRRLLALWRR